MPNPRSYKNPRSRSVSKSPLTSPTLERDDPLSRQVAFVPFSAGAPSGISDETRRAVRVQAAKASAAARKQTIARKLAEKSGQAFSTETSPTSSTEQSEESRRASSTSAAESDPTKSITSRSPSQSLDVSPVDPTTRIYPISQWHPLIPSIVDYFTKYFLPDATLPQDAYGRDAMRTQLWPLALSDTCLFHAILLNAASHAVVTGALNVPTSLLAQLKHTALEGINEAIAGLDFSQVGEAIIDAIALVGAWELQYGTADTYETHMGGLSAIVNNLPGGFVGAQTILPPATINVIYTAGHDLAVYASKRPFFDVPGAPALSTSPLLPSTLPAAFEKLKTQHLLLPSFMQLISRLSNVLPEDPAARARLDEVQQALLEWEVENVTATTYCPLRTVLEDAAIRQVYLHMRLAALALCGYTRFAMNTDAQQFLQSLYNEALLLQSDLLVGTCFEELIFWCLSTISATTGRCEHKHMRSLKRFTMELGITSWEEARRSWTQFIYPSSLDSRAHALWQAVNNSTVARDPSVGMGEPTRYAKGIGHPTTHIAALVAAEEG
ncbi:hypothetical protein CKM354_000525200 [Cercospora kikuchii]|uniref:Uncharacterized protein n=1 Tax=Cercospora kikuchii TaxID=84275 RepID=A0A9P3FGL4_9PEZI|nr:uncharacterized protein CKM354_000525200 [Cercospora kikuchii]GIZ41969.1 hypothetical protein CKM354_000525200 [Cercospora kikuchii]